jgi:hypothetical protein
MIMTTEQSTDIQLINYTASSIALIGLGTKRIKDAIKSIGGSPNFNLTINGKKTFGWVFPLSKLSLVQSLLTSEACGTVPENGTPEASGVTVPRILMAEAYKVEHRDCEGFSTKVPMDKVVITKPKHTKSALKAYMLANLPELLTSIIGETNISSVVMNDTKFLPDDGKRFVMLGCGCGFSWIKCDGRSKLGTSMIKDSQALKAEIEKEMLKGVDKGLLKSLEACGNPLQAMMAQNLNYKAKYNGIAMRYMRQFDIKGLTMQNYDD